MYLYFIQARSYVKIGYASDPVDRMNELQVGNPIPMQIVAVVRCNSQGHAQEFERAIHSIVRRYSIRGEWFEYGPIAWAISRLRTNIHIDEACSIFRNHLKHQRAKRGKGLAYA